MVRNKMGKRRDDNLGQSRHNRVATMVHLNSRTRHQ
jgi:hypothetical protein